MPVEAWLDNNKNQQDAISRAVSRCNLYKTWCWIKSNVTKAKATTHIELDAAVFRSWGGIRPAQI